MKKLNGRFVDESGIVVFDEDGLEDLIFHQKLTDAVIVQKTYETDLFSQQLSKHYGSILNFYQGPLPLSIDQWNTPESYKIIDIESFIMDKCSTIEEQERVAIELSMFNDRGLYPLLRHMVFLVDHFSENNIVWGVGRGSSVSSYVLFLLGIHKINSIKYQLSIDEFLK